MRALLAPRRWLGHLLAVAAVGVTVVLGAWQLDNWREARADQARDRSGAEPVALDEALGPNDPFGEDAVGQPVEISGRWLPEATVRVTGREQDGEAGSWVATPLVTDSGSAIYVVRGFTSNNEAPPPSATDAELVALLQPPEGTGAVDNDAGDDVLPQLRTADLVQRQDEDLYGGYAVLDADRSPDAAAATEGLQRARPEQLPTADRTTGLRNVLYAVEWWLFGAFVVVVWGRWARDVVLVERAAREAAEHPTPGQVGEDQPVGSAP